MPSEPSFARRVFFSAVVVLGLWLFLEAGAFVGFRIVDGRLFGFARLHAEQADVAGAAIGVEPEEAAAAARRPEAWLPRTQEAVHPYLGYVLDPTLARESLTRRDTVSDWGFPDSAPPFQRRSPDRVIVGLLGGSLARQFAESALEPLAAELARAPRFAGREIVFVRLAMNGYKQPQQLQTVSYLLALGAEFDLLINIDGFNEVALHEPENAPSGVFAAYPRAWYPRTRALPDPPTRSAIGELGVLRRRRQDWAAAFVSSPLRYSIAANLVWRARDRRLQAELAGIEEFLRDRRPAEDYKITGPPRSYADRAELYEDLATLWRRSSLQLDRLARGNGIDYFHFLQPNQYVEGAKPMGAIERRAAWRESHSYRPGVEAGYPRLIRQGEQLAASGVRFRDLTTVFADVEEPIYRDTCCHVNAAGNAILAREIAAFILENLGKAESAPP